MLKKWVPFWTIPTLITLSIGTVWLRLAIVRTTYVINQSNQLIQSARNEREKLELKLAALKSPRRLEALARTKFGLSQPRTNQMVHLKNLEISLDDL
jgi:cell division protein FtsL